MTFKISLKWGKELVPVEVDTNESISVLKMQIYSLTRVPPEGQKIMVPRVGALREDMPWSKYNLKDGVVWMLVGTAEDQQLQKPEATVFMEDIASTAVKVFKHKGGLANLGNTCYLNSSVQLLASVPELQKRLSTYRPDVQGGAEARVVSSFRQVINDLDKRDQVIPFDFVQVFRDAFPQFAEQSEGGGYAQQDADESLSALIRCLGQVSGLEKEGSSASDLVTQLFTGSMQTTSKCIEAEDEPPESETTTFNKLSCHISSTTNFLHEGLKGGLEDHLCKYSPALDRDAQYAKSSRIAKLPPYLCVQFVRFWWNDKAKVKAKISRPVDFPMRLDMFDYCTEQLQEKLTPIRKAIANQQLSSKAPSDTMEVESKGEDIPLTLENETGTYELKAVITHRGRVADSGHYVAWVKSANSEWLLFDDETVTPVTIEDIRLLTGSGGADWHIAYVCLYASVPKPTGLVVTEEATATSTSTSSSSSSSSLSTTDQQ